MARSTKRGSAALRRAGKSLPGSNSRSRRARDARPAARAEARSALPCPAAIPGARAAPLPKFVPPQLATLVAEAPRGDEWLHEMKFDGYRILARLEGGRARLLSRNGKDWTDHFPAVARGVARL